MNHLKRIIAALLCSVAISAPMAAMNVQAATFSQINANEVFINQDTKVTCTLASNVMMLRRAAMLLGDPNWMTITEKSCHYLWSGAGMTCDYTFYGTTKDIVVVNEAIRHVVSKDNKQSIKQYLINMLKAHPEGIVYYDYDIPHAILLTDYDAKEDMFYCSDPNIGTPTKRVPLTNSKVNLYNYYRSSVWYIKSPELHFTSGSTATSGAAQGKQDIVENLDETWKITDDWGVNLRSSHEVKDNNRIGYVPYGAVVKVTKRKISGGYNWGYVNYQSQNGWIALDYATKIEDSKPEIKEEPKQENTGSAFDNVSTLSAEEIVLGEKITFKGAAQKGTAPYTYAYYYKRSYSNTWTTVKDFSDSRSETVEPLTATVYDVCVKIKDAKGNLEKKYMTFRVRKPLTNKSSAVSSAVYLGDEIHLKGKASGGIGAYQYAYYYKKNEETDWIKLNDFSEETTASFKPLKVTDYDICIKVRDEKGHVEKVYQTVTVRPKLVNQSEISSENIRLGDTIQMTASALGGEGGYQYAFYYKRTENENWVTSKSFSEDSSAELKPLKDTTYEICIKVRDFYGRVEKKYFTVNVTK